MVAVSRFEMPKVQFLFSVCVFICQTTAKRSIGQARQPIRLGKGIPVPHAEFLERVIKRNLFPNKTEEQTYLDMYGDISDLDNLTLDRLQNLEYSVLDVDNVKLFVKMARRSLERDSALDAAPAASGRRRFPDAYALYDGHIMRKLLALMQQSIYATRMQLQRTNKIRAKYGLFIFQPPDLGLDPGHPDLVRGTIKQPRGITTSAV